MKKVLLFLLLLVVSLAVVPLFLPKTLYVEDEYVFDYEVSSVFENFYDMKKYTQFDEWSQKDPHIKIDYSSPNSGPNAYFTWQSELPELGNGEMKIVDSKLEEFITYDITYDEMKGNTSELIFQKMDDHKTKVIWSFESAEASYPFQVYNWLMKSSVKEQLHLSLVNLDRLLKKEKQNNNKEPFAIKNFDQQQLFGVLQSTSIESGEINTAMAETLGFVKSYLRDAEHMEEKKIGKPIVLWKLYDIESNKAMFYAGYFIKEKVPEVDGMEYVDFEKSRVVTAVHKGSYNNLPNTYEAMRKYAESKGLELSPEWFNVYLNKPEEVKAESQLRTEINIPIIE